VVTPNVLCKGELKEENMQKLEVNGKRKLNEDIPFEPRKMHGICRDYKKLQDPFLESKEEMSPEYANAMEEGDDYHSSKDAQTSAEWPEWEHTIQIELKQLKEMGTWQLVDKPTDATLIANKWVFTKKRDKVRHVVKYKAWLIAKGCAQRPGHDYVEMFSPVVHLETICAILALVPSQKWKVHQIDIKGAYLNGMLEEWVYMQQPWYT